MYGWKVNSRDKRLSAENGAYVSGSGRTGMGWIERMREGIDGAGGLYIRCRLEMDLLP